ncbi:hypothetical protein FHR32_002295 [Streptosporangium album]|uniref:Uncharacterized protein n=1 Tax=Streptosporangium album TaxID=47479 RepID=A0A7W7RTR6_9ACTN|nr:hypothetical protein [Streptosporangium album]
MLSGAKNLDIEHEDLKDAFNRAMTRLDHLGNFWGHDEAGRKFGGAEGGKGYLGAREEARKHVRNIVDSYSATASNLHLNDFTVRAADTAAAESAAMLARLDTEVKSPEIVVPSTRAELG